MKTILKYIILRERGVPVVTGMRLIPFAEIVYSFLKTTCIAKRLALLSSVSRNCRILVSVGDVVSNPANRVK